MNQLDNLMKYFFRRSGISIDFSQIGFSEEFLSIMHNKIMNDFDEMLALETGAIVNKDENRMVGHYWLWKKSLSSTVEIKN